MFINRESVCQAGDTTLRFLYNKITRLYSLYDTGLNTINRNYSRFIQDMNSDELAINHNSLTTVFSLSSNFGASLSHRTAERRLVEQADPDLCYYNTYIKKYPMIYMTSLSRTDTKQMVSMRDCHIILFLDN